MTVLAQAEVLPRRSYSPLAEVYETRAFRDEWDNDVRFHVARNLLHLRRFRGVSRKQLAAAVGTSQSAVARIESAQENITLDTVERFVHGLDGRFFVSIQPAEHATLPARTWWDTITSPPWNVVRVERRQTGLTDQVLVGLERDHVSSGFVGSTRLLTEANTSSVILSRR